jgi:hypothetical protein
MRYYKYLKNSFPVYIFSGVLLGLAVLSLVTIHRYNNNLQDTLDTLKSINVKEENIKTEINRTDKVIKYFQDNFGVIGTEINPERLILHALDEMKTHLNAASITVSGFEEAPGEKQLPVEIRIPVNSYRMIIDYVGYIESFRFPKYSVKNLSITKEQSGGVVLNIQGGFVIPLKTDS